MEGVGSVVDPLRKDKIYEATTNIVLLFKAEDIRDMSSLLVAASSENRKKLDELYKLDHNYMQ